MFDRLSNSNQSKEHVQSAPEHIASEVASWMRNNVADPLINSAVLEPIDAVTSTFDTISGTKLLPQPKLASVARSNFLSANWFAQTISSGIGMVVPFCAANRVVGATFGLAGERLFAESKIGSILTNSKVALISSAAIYGGMMKPQAGDSRLGNALASAGGFAVFGMGNELSQALDPMPRLAAKVATGFAGGITGLALDSAANGKMPDASEFAQAGLSGAVLNLAFPFGQRNLDKGFVETKDAVEKPETNIRPLDQEIAGGLPRKEIVFDRESTKRAEGVNGAKAYTVDGKQFWQLPDGRIFFFAKEGEILEPSKPEIDGRVDNASEVETNDRPEVAVWTPFGANKPMSYVVDDTGEGVYRQRTLDEAQGLMVDDKGEFVRTYEVKPEEPSPALKIPMQPTPAGDGITADGMKRFGPAGERLYSMSELSMLPHMLETDEVAARRIVTEDGARFERGTMTLDGIGSAEGQTVDARIYRILSENAVNELHKIDQNRTQVPATQDDEVRRAIVDTATKVLVPEEYARKLDAVRELRRLAALNVDQHPEIAEDIRTAARNLFASDYHDRFLPEHIGQFIDEVPTRSTVAEVHLIDGRLASSPDAMAQAFADQGKMRFFAHGYRSGSQVSEFARHEWMHLIEPDQSKTLREIEGGKGIESFVGRDYANKDGSELWAVNGGEMFLAADPKVFLTLASKAPIRTVLLADAIERQLGTQDAALKDAPEQVKNSQLSIHDQAIRARVAFANDKVLPIAREQLRNALKNGSFAQLKGVHDLLGSTAYNLPGIFEKLAFSMADYEQQLGTSFKQALDQDQFDPSLARRVLVQHRFLDFSSLSHQLVAEHQENNRALLAKYQAAQQPMQDEMSEKLGLAADNSRYWSFGTPHFERTEDGELTMQMLQTRGHGELLTYEVKLNRDASEVTISDGEAEPVKLSVEQFRRISANRDLGRVDSIIRDVYFEERNKDDMFTDGTRSAE